MAIVSAHASLVEQADGERERRADQCSAGAGGEQEARPVVATRPGEPGQDEGTRQTTPGTSGSQARARAGSGRTPARRLPLRRLDHQGSTSSSLGHDQDDDQHDVHQGDRGPGTARQASRQAPTLTGAGGFCLSRRSARPEDPKAGAAGERPGEPRTLPRTRRPPSAGWRADCVDRSAADGACGVGAHRPGQAPGLVTRSRGRSQGRSRARNRWESGPESGPESAGVGAGVRPAVVRERRAGPTAGAPAVRRTSRPRGRSTAPRSPRR